VARMKTTTAAARRMSLGLVMFMLESP